MSRIFDALQRSGTEQSGVEYPDMMSVAAAVYETPRDQGSSDVAVGEQVSAIPTTPEQIPIFANPEQQEESRPPVFPSLLISVSPSSRLVFLTQPESLAAEKFRFLGVRLRQLRQSRPLRRVLITSTIPEEGKSLVSVNLAGVLARRKEKVLLIEGDLRRPVLAEQLGLGRLAGLSEWLQSQPTSASNIYHLSGAGFWIMPAGDPPSNPLELMQSGRLSRLVEQLTGLFDWIIVDSPPLLPLGDTTVWARLTDGTLLVTREDKTERKSLQHGLEMIRKSDLLGVVLNGCTELNHDNYYRRYSRPATK